ncbi:MAG: FAD:protein FMN transferase [Candidatus Lernaella stagnicola]|nr:FAD:protein FMN transferase [Candidatus Lernaella stagnicola]
MRHRVLAGLVVLAWLMACSPEPAPLPRSPSPVSERRILMGTQVEINIFGTAKSSAQQALKAGFDAMEQVQSWAHPEWPSSELYQLNAAAGKEPRKLNPQLFAVLKMAHEISIHSQGAFDVTFAGGGKLWDLKNPEAFRVPTDAELREAIKSIDYRRVKLDESSHSAFIEDSDTRVNLGGIAKGWAADMAMQALKKNGVQNAIVNIGGDMLVAGSKNGVPWRIGVQDPRRPRGSYFTVLEATGSLAIATSGDYERFVIHDGIRYHHILDPKTGRPARRCRSVTLVASTAALADALATAVFVLGPEEGAAMLQKYYPETDSLIIDAVGATHETPGFSAWQAGDKDE